MNEISVSRELEDSAMKDKLHVDTEFLVNSFYSLKNGSKGESRFDLATTAFLGLHGVA